MVKRHRLRARSSQPSAAETSTHAPFAPTAHLSVGAAMSITFLEVSMSVKRLRHLARLSQTSAAETSTPAPYVPMAHQSAGGSTLREDLPRLKARLSQTSAAETSTPAPSVLTALPSAGVLVWTLKDRRRLNRCHLKARLSQTSAAEKFTHAPSAQTALPSVGAATNQISRGDMWAKRLRHQAITSQT